jgi:type III secretion protein L
VSSKKFFTLIHGDAVHIAPQAKVIPADSFSVLIDAEGVLSNVKKDAEKYKIEVASEVEAWKEQAKKEGYEEGFKEWAEHIANLEAEIIKVRKDLEKSVVPVALKAAKKILGREIELSETAIVDIVSSSLKSVAQHKKITIYVSKKDFDVIETNRPKLKQIFESLESLSIRERSDVAPGGCIIETEGGIINAQLENQWKVLTRALEAIMKPKTT